MKIHNFITLRELFPNGCTSTILSQEDYQKLQAIPDYDKLLFSDKIYENCHNVTLTKEALNLINPLWYRIMKAFREEGIYSNLTIPFFLGIYRMDKRISDLSSPQCIKDLLEEIINTFSEDEIPGIFKCEDIFEWVVSTQCPQVKYSSLTNASGRSIFINLELTNILEPTIDNVSRFFWEVYSDCLQNTHFSKRGNDWRSYSPEELKIITKVLNL